MAQTCIGLCERLKTIPVKNGLRYSTGQKRCSLCAHYFYIDSCRCPCCKTRLRSKPRSRHKNKNFGNSWFYVLFFWIIHILYLKKLPKFWLMMRLMKDLNGIG